MDSLSQPTVKLKSCNTKFFYNERGSRRKNSRVNLATTYNTQAENNPLQINDMADSLISIFSDLSISPSLLNLPAEIMHGICIQLDLKSLAVMTRTSGKWRSYIKDNTSTISAEIVVTLLKELKIEG
jgi:hypothetical protein